jgi:transcriptional antiterminator RfaH
MDFMTETRWFAVQTKPHQEALAAARLGQLNLETFLPRFQGDVFVCGITRLVVKPLFPSYLFARFCPLVSYDAVRHVSGVLRVVGNRHAPIPLEPEVIASLRSRIQADGYVRLQRRRLQPGEKVQIEQGPFAGWIAEVEREWDDGRRVAILLGALQQARMVIQRRWLEPCEAT